MNFTSCYHCGKLIQGEAKIVVPPILHERLFGAVVKSYHPKCYANLEEAAAAKELAKS